MNKKELRQSALQSRRAMPSTRITELSWRVEENLVGQKEFRDARRVASYVAKEDEVQTAPILERALSEGKVVVVPVVDRQSDELLFFEIRNVRELSPGKFGVREPKRNGSPVPLSETDVVLVPLLAWDGRGHRVGYGKGYFDRALATRGSSRAIGLAFESQAVTQVPEEVTDVQLDMVVTEKQVLRFGRKAA
ncbi:MAG: 5-formyltetrahydrofolate cyclo-ligase [Thaumarchaeota archaeon]|nr:5-formyltetrahydrofolate cyclo-ligase [Nitrososphaerota archaeon]